ncbi:hypothetical protein RUESEDTHA_01985 [Ruegeria sp. THAF57]|uniref:hypothetical protein n=1 Tax=Ruegeria sp. THAF57 TaxID=2744555 RepID=UPI0015DD8DCF|nr:hypothetical protein [Ruegeria sp. THAF57]CAD0185099.1 hypothetical protein RUESEDTHA_01985 [Ruegeria sp. THAF57]
MQEQYRQAFYLFLGLLLTFFLLLVLGAINVNYPGFTSLEAHWVALSLLPLLAFLWFGGYITRFNAFGVEIQNVLKSPIGDSLEIFRKIEVSGILSMKDEFATRKGSGSKLENMSLLRRQKVRMLKFEIGHHYNTKLVLDYFKALPNLKYVEVVDRRNRLVSVVTLNSIFLNSVDDRDRLLWEEDEFLLRRVEDFLTSLHNMIEGPYILEFEEKYPDVALRLDSSATVNFMLESVRLYNASVVAIENEQARCLAVITQEQLIKYLSNIVVRNNVS